VRRRRLRKGLRRRLKRGREKRGRKRRKRNRDCRMLKLVVGLGNPEAKYQKTRHNVGFRVIDRFSGFSGIELQSRKHFSIFGKGEIAGERVILAKPLTYVNLSGKAVGSFMHYYRVSLDDLLLVYDDMDLAPGKIRLRPCGSSGGHNGVESVITALGSDRFPRVRIGIGRKELAGMTDADFVLRNFPRDEKPVIEEAIDRGARAVEAIIREGISAAMDKFN
jgi:PTH1 family peptidyl-tRNA hydrolase